MLTIKNEKDIYLDDAKTGLALVQSANHTIIYKVSNKEALVLPQRNYVITSPEFENDVRTALMSMS